MKFLRVVLAFIVIQGFHVNLSLSATLDEDAKKICLAIGNCTSDLLDNLKKICGPILNSWAELAGYNFNMSTFTGCYYLDHFIVTYKNGSIEAFENPGRYFIVSDSSSLNPSGTCIYRSDKKVIRNIKKIDCN